MAEPLVDLIIAVHTPARPIARAVASVLRFTRSPVRVSVVCHNTDPDPISSALGELRDDPRLRLLRCVDGIASPAGPFNTGLDAASAPFTSVMGSDDELQPGAIDAWLARQRRDRAAAVIARLVHAGGRGVPTPPVRPGRRSGLDGVKDRLSYRSAPLGLVSRAEFASLRFTPGLPTGEDVGYVTRLWFSGNRISFDRGGPAYLIHDDAEDRVSFAAKPIAQELAFLALLLRDPWVLALDAVRRRSLAVKLLRIHIFGAVTYRRDASAWLAAERDALAAAVRECLRFSPESLRVLARADRALLDAILDPSSRAERLIDLAVRRRRFPMPDTVIPRNLAYVGAREAPLRMLFASVLVR